ncbi:unnamed protein product [Owenia fusiformis]|uniref:Uncharacterized protein n=1 Tax=Owenia fusiformis TaxID=6347 RepID=A0A8J1TGE8_OWEFU|nr:unnamed protein product [Owenia fusiformis]
MFVSADLDWTNRYPQNTGDKWMKQKGSTMGKQCGSTLETSDIQYSLENLPDPVEVEDIYACVKCSIEYPTQRCLDYHSTVVHNKYCDVCNMRLDHLGEEQLLTHGQSHTGMKSHQCQHCYKLFQTKNGLSVHLANDLQCLLCGARFIKTGKWGHMKQHKQK